jgi:hydrogenase-4 component E
MYDIGFLILVFLLVSILLLLGSSRILTLIKIICFQGILISIFPIVELQENLFADFALSMVTLMIKGVLIPIMLIFAIKKLTIKREVEPVIGFHFSIFIALILIIISNLIAEKLNFSPYFNGQLIITVAISLIVSGLLIITTRKKALTQVIGYLTMENGIYLVGLLSSEHHGYIIEFGVLLDVLVAVMLMGIVINNINQAFDDCDVTKLRNLKDI